MVSSELKIPFGKYKGTAFKDLPDSYAAWLLHDEILRGPDFNEALKEAIWQKITESKEVMIKKWVDDHYTFKSWSSGGYGNDFGDIYQDNGYDCPYDEFDGYGNLTVDFGF